MASQRFTSAAGRRGGRERIAVSLLILVAWIAPGAPGAASSNASPTTAPAKIEKWPVPTEAQRRAAEKQVRDAIGDEPPGGWDRTRAAQIARELLDVAATTSDPPTRYVILTHAKDLAIAGGDRGDALAARDQLAKAFAVDPHRLSLEVFDGLSRSLSSREDWAKLCDAILASTQRAVAADRYEVAMPLAHLATAAAQKSGRPDDAANAATESARVASFEAEYHRLAPAFARLHRKPDDAEANTAVGRFVCFWHEDWDRGLPMLARGSDVTLKEAAAGELARSADPAEQARVADLWWQTAGGQPVPAKTALLKRAGMLYRVAAPKLTGLAQVAAKNRLDELQKLGIQLPAGRVVNLMEWIDPDKDAVTGTWQMTDGELTVDGKGSSRLRIPYDPPPEYDFHIRFKRVRGNHDVCQMLRANGHPFAWLMGADDNHNCAFCNVDGAYLTDNPTTKPLPAPIKNGRDYDAVVKVRKDGVSAYLDGKQINHYSTSDFADLNIRDIWSVHGVGLGVGSWQDADSFSVIEVVEITGKGKRLPHAK